MARFMRRQPASYGHSDLRPPVVIGAAEAFYGPKSALTQPLGRNNGGEDRRAASSRLRPPVVVNTAAEQPLARPIDSTLFAVRRRVRQPRYTVQAILRPPAVIGAGISFHGPRVLLTRPSRGQPYSRLAPPAVLTQVVQPLARPIDTTLFAVRRRVRQPRYATVSTLRAPVVVNTETFTPCAFTTDDFNRANENPISGIWQDWESGTTPLALESNQLTTQPGEPLGAARLRQNIDATGPWQMSATIGAGTFVNPGSAITLVLLEASNLRIFTEVSPLYIRLGFNNVLPYSILQPTQVGDKIALQRTVSGATETVSVWQKKPSGSWQKYLEVTRTPNTFGVAVAGVFLQSSSDVVALDDFSVCPYSNAPVSTTLQRSRPRRTYSRLEPPTVVATTESFYGPAVQLVRSSRGRPLSYLAPPTVIGASFAPRGPRALFTYSRRGQAHSRLAPPAVVTQVTADVFVGPHVTLTKARPRRPVSALHPPIIPPLARPTQTTLARGRRGRALSHLAPPVVVLLAVELYGPVVSLAPSTRLARAAHVRLAPPAVVFTAVELSGPEISLAPSRRGAPKSHLAPPTVVAPTGTFYGPVVHVVRGRKGATFVRGITPTVVGAGIVYPPVAVYLAPSKRGTPKSALHPPTVTAAADTYYGPAVTLVRGRAGGVKSVLHPPIIPALAAPIVIKLARIRPVITRTKLVPPAVVGAGIVYRPVAAHLAYSRRGVPKSRLEPPTVLASADRYYGPTVKLTYSRRGTSNSFLRGLPTGASNVYVGPLVHLAPSKRGIPKSLLRKPPFFLAPFEPISVTLVRAKPRPTVANLAPPTVVQSATLLFFGPDTTLAYSRRGRPSSTLIPPAVVGAGIVYRPIQATLVRIRPRPTIHSLGIFPPQAVIYAPITVALAPSSRGLAKSHLSAPAVIGDGIVYRPLQTHLTYSLRGAPKSRLAPPTVIAEAEHYYGPKVTLTRIRPRPVQHTLGIFPPQAVIYAPIVVRLAASKRGKATSFLRGLPTGASNVYVGPIVHLAASKRGAPKSRLTPPAVVAEVSLAQPITVSLAPQARGLAKSSLHAPAVIGAGIAYDGPGVVLARNKTQPTHSQLAPPRVVQAQNVVFYGPKVELTYSRRGKPIRKLRAPAVVGAGIVFRPIRVNLVTDRKRIADERVLQRAPLYRLGPPIVVRLAVEIYGPETTLAPSKRGRRISQLAPPTVVAAPAVYSGPVVHLTRGRAGAPKTHLAAPVVVRLAVEIYGPLVSLAPSKRGRPLSHLGPPTVVAEAEHYYGPQVHLTRGRAGIPLARLAAPVVVRLATEIYGPVVSLAPSRFPTPKAKLSPPIIPPLARPIAVSLAPQSREPGLARLRPPAVVGKAPFRALATSLAYSLRGKASYRLNPPTVVGKAVELSGPVVSLAPSFRGKPISRLLPPAVVRYFQAPAIRTHLARITVPPTIARLFPPAVIGEGIVYRSIQTYLVRITHPPVQSNLFSPTDTILETPGDAFCDDSTPFSADCDETAPEVCGITDLAAPGGTVTGGDSANSHGSMTGGTSGSSSVSGGDQGG